MAAIRTPDDERSDWLYPPFREGWWYQGATYPGHSNYSVDWNRRTKTGGWLDDTGDPVLAMQDGTVALVDKGDGLVMLHHHGGLTQVELRHMQDIVVKPGQKVKRGDRIGSIGNVAGDGRSFGAHLHMVQYARKATNLPFRRVPLTIEGKRVPVSVEDSDTRPASWDPPPPVMLQGPPPKATWESAYREALALAEKRATALDAQKAQTALATDERDQARRELVGMTDRLNGADVLLQQQAARIAELEARPPADCAACEDEVVRLRDVLDRVKALVTL